MSATLIENGERIAFDHPSSAGRAALVSFNGKTTLAYFPGAGEPPALGTTIVAKGASYRVTTYRLLRKPRMHKLGLEPVTPSA